MMPVFESSAEYFWVWALALLIVFAGIVSRIYRNRRHRVFCNPALFGRGQRWYYQGVAILLLALGISLAAAIIPASTDETLRKEDSQPVIGILFDSDSVAKSAVVPQDLSNWLNDSIRWIIGNAPEEKISVWQTSERTELLIPSTWDTQAVQMLAAVAFTAPAESGIQDVPVGVASMLLTLRGSRSMIVVLSARTTKEIELLALGVADSGKRVVFVHAPDNPISEPQFCHQDAAGKWIWQSDASRFRELLQNEQQPNNGINSLFARMSVIQILALLALVFLTAESMWHFLTY